jgi:hypothetical protein
MAMQGDVRAGSWARRGRRLLLSLGVLAAGGLAVLFLAAFALVSGHGGVLQVMLIAVLALMAMAAAVAVAVAWIARRLWLRGAWLEALPLLVGLPWLSRVMWAVRVLWTGRAVWRLRNRVPSRRADRRELAGQDLSGFSPQELSGFAAQDLTGARSGTTR